MNRGLVDMMRMSMLFRRRSKDLWDVNLRIQRCCCHEIFVTSRSLFVKYYNHLLMFISFPISIFFSEFLSDLVMIKLLLLIELIEINVLLHAFIIEFLKQSHSFWLRLGSRQNSWFFILNCLWLCLLKFILRGVSLFLLW